MWWRLRTPWSKHCTLPHLAVLWHASQTKPSANRESPTVNIPNTSQHPSFKPKEQTHGGSKHVFSFFTLCAKWSKMHVSQMAYCKGSTEMTKLSIARILGWVWSTLQPQFARPHCGQTACGDLEMQCGKCVIIVYLYDISCRVVKNKGWMVSDGMIRPSPANENHGCMHLP